MDNTVTILMSTYNGEKYLDEQLESIYNQTIKYKINIVVRDDGSTDNTLNILKKWNKRLNMKIIEGKNKGVVKSFNELLSIAPKADYYAFSDQDDVWDKDKLEVAINMLENDEKENEPKLYFSNASLVDDRLNKFNRNVHSEDIEINLIKIMICNPALGCTMVFNKEALEMINKINIKNSPMHDKTALIITFLTGKVIYDSQPRMLYRQHDNNVMGTGNSLKKRLRQIYQLWIKNNNCSIDSYSNELLYKMDKIISKEQKDILNMFSEYKINFRYRINLVFNKRVSTGKGRIDRSFKIRVLLGLA